MAIEFTDLEDGLSYELGDELNARFNALKAGVNLAYQFRGEWEDDYNYDENDGVIHDGSLYIAVADNINDEPPSASWLQAGGKGEKGETGPEGPQGAQGEPGETGAQGPAGEKGDSGDSAYEIAVANGFSGTEQQWLESLEGEQGPQGPPGQDGAGAVESVNGQDGVVVLDKTDIGLGNVTNDAQLKASQLDTDDTLAADSNDKIPSQKAVKAYVDANAGGDISAVTASAPLESSGGSTPNISLKKPAGDAGASEAVFGDDTRLSDSRAPKGGAGGVLSGSYPNPGFAVDMATQSELDSGLATKANTVHSHDNATTSTSGFMSGADKTKLNGIATGATANATNAQLRDRSTHTGTQSIGTITNLQSTLDDKADLVDGKVPSAQLPAYVSEIDWYYTKENFPSTGTEDVLYVAMNTNLVYRWSGMDYVEISPSVALGETSSTAYRGDRGKTAYDHTSRTDNPHGVTAAQVGAAATNHTHAAATTSAAGFMSSADKTKLNGIANSATANATNAQLRDRSTHTGAQAISTITNLQNTLDGKASSSHTHVADNITDATPVGKSVLKAANADAARAAIEAGNVSTTGTQTLNDKTLIQPVIINPEITSPTGFLTGTSKITVSDTEPSSPSEGDIWIDTSV